MTEEKKKRRKKRKAVRLVELHFAAVRVQEAPEKTRIIHRGRSGSPGPAAPRPAPTGGCQGPSPPGTARRSFCCCESAFAAEFPPLLP